MTNGEHQFAEKRAAAERNRRVSGRKTATKELFVRYKKVNFLSFLKKYKDCDAIDFYRRGIGFIANEEFEKYETIQLEITYRFKKCSGVQGLIVHKKPLGPRSFRYGLMFKKDIDIATQEKLIEIETMLGSSTNSAI